VHGQQNLPVDGVEAEVEIFAGEEAGKNKSEPLENLRQQTDTRLRRKLELRRQTRRRAKPRRS